MGLKANEVSLLVPIHPNRTQSLMYSKESVGCRERSHCSVKPCDLNCGPLGASLAFWGSLVKIQNLGSHPDIYM